MPLLVYPLLLVAATAFALYLLPVYAGPLCLLALAAALHRLHTKHGLGTGEDFNINACLAIATAHVHVLWSSATIYHTGGAAHIASRMLPSHSLRRRV